MPWSDENIKTIAITGAGTGIGRSCAELFLKKGYRVALIGRRKKLLEDVKKQNPDALVIPCDISKHEEVCNTFNLIETQWGRLDVLFNNAGLALPGCTIDEMHVDDWKEMVNVNLTGTFLCAKEAFRIMRKQQPQGGRIINNGSISSHVPRPGSAAYTSTKHAITGLTKTLSLDGRPFSIACSQIDIGNALTDLTAGFSKGALQPNGLTIAEPTIDLSNVAQSVLHMVELPLDANVQYMTLIATKMPYIGRG